MVDETKTVADPIHNFTILIQASSSSVRCSLNFCFVELSETLSFEEAMGDPWKEYYCCWVLPLLALLLFSSFPSIHGQSFDNSENSNTANLSSSWSINIGYGFQIILVRESKNGTAFWCGFYCQSENNACVFSVVVSGIEPYYDAYMNGAIEHPQVVWTANGSNPVRSNATLELTEEGDLILADADGTPVWSTNTSGKSVAGLNLTETGNLVLFDTNKAPIWQSFDRPTDSLLPGQKLVSGKKLTASRLASNGEEELISLAVTDEGLVAYVESRPPQIYYKKTVKKGLKSNPEPSYVQLRDGSLDLFIHNADPDHPDSGISIPAALSTQFMKLESDGHLRVYEWRESQWNEVIDLLTEDQGDCGYPMMRCGSRSDCEYPTVCGKYGICTGEKQCSCPASSDDGTIYFREVKERQSNLGCPEIRPISCNSSQYHSLLQLENIYYFTFRLDMDTDIENCKQACMRNCSCKAALFRYGSNSSSGGCFLIPEVFSLISNSEQRVGFNFSMFLKVENSPNENKPNQTRKKATRMGIILGSSLGVSILVGTCFLLFRVKKDSMGVEEVYLDLVPGMPTRFSHEDLRSATKDFNQKLGEGGFGSVFEGVLSSGVKVAVKRLEGFGQVKKSFLAEVETIGSIHHVNLVRLAGFCAEKSHRLLVYEYMSNGSLDKWIFHKNRDLSLSWQSRRKIILGIAKGLAYLHEECRQKIIHLDIKPQNILLDENLNAKVSDFGLSKLIDKDQSQVVTTMKGTPGYLAPEWLSSVISEKVDVYSFGIVVLEILCGRRNIDRSQPEEDMHLLTTFKRKAEEVQLEDMIDKASADMQLHGAEVLEMMMLATWCLQHDFAKRPSMSMVVKLLEGSVDVQPNLDYNFSYAPPRGNSLTIALGDAACFTPLLPSALSGPR